MICTLRRLKACFLATSEFGRREAPQKHIVLHHEMVGHKNQRRRELKSLEMGQEVAIFLQRAAYFRQNHRDIGAQNFNVVSILRKMRIFGHAFSIF